MKLTKEQKETLKEIYQMSHYDMCDLWRYAPSGHPYFDKTLPFSRHFIRRLFKHFGGFTPEISKSLG